MSPDFALRLAKPSDFAAFLALKSEPENIKWSNHGSSPDAVSMRVWWDHQMVSPTRVIWAIDLTGMIGYAYVDRVADYFETTVAVSAKFAGLGIARAAVRLNCKHIHRLSPQSPIFAWIDPANTASCRAHRAAGFYETNEPHPSKPALLRWVWKETAR